MQLSSHQWSKKWLVILEGLGHNTLYVHSSTLFSFPQDEFKDSCSEKGPREPSFYHTEEKMVGEQRRKNGRNLKSWMTVWHRAGCLPTLDPYVKEKQTSWTFNLCNVGPVCYNSRVLYPRVTAPWEQSLGWKFTNFEQTDGKITAIIWEAIRRAGVRRILARNIFKCSLNLVDTCEN